MPSAPPQRPSSSSGPAHDLAQRFRSALACEERGDWAGAAIGYHALLEADPGRFDVCCRLGWVLNESGQPQAALESLAEAARLCPHAPRVRTLMAAIHKAQGQWAEAVACCRGEVSLAPGDAGLHHNLGLALHGAGDLPAARQAYSRALGLAPGSASAWLHLGMLNQDEVRVAEAVRCYQESSRLDPRAAEPHWQLATAWLALGEFERGWPQMEWRWKQKNFTTAPEPFPHPVWDGRDPAGLRLLVHAEQGLGDAIQFIRFASVLAQRGARVIVGCPPALRRLFQSAPGVSQVVTSRDQAPLFDCHVPVMSLPARCGTTLQTLPAQVPYLSAPGPAPALPAARPNALRVGLVWAGNPGHLLDRARSMPLAAAAPLFEVPGVEWYSLQAGPQTAELAASGLAGRIHDLGSRATDMGDTAGWIAQLDLVVSVDTAVAHLAGALGRPVWTLLPRPSEWRWMLGRDDSPWYPTMRLFRQTLPGDWAGLARRVAAELARRTQSVALAARSELAAGLEEVRAGRKTQAADCFARAAKENPKSFEALYNLALARHELGDLPEARRCYQLALDLNPGHPGAWNGLGAAFKQSGDTAQAIRCCEHSLRLAPENPDALNNLANALRAAERHPEALERGRQAVQLAPAQPLLWHNLGNILRESGDLAGAVQAFERALALRPEFAEAHWDLAFALLLGGDFERGWAEFEWRFKRADYPRRGFTAPLWTGGPAPRGLLVHAEQGFGDSLQFVRFLPELARRAGTVILECQPSLAPLFQGACGAARVVPRGQALPPFQTHIPLMSLPRALGVRIDALPAPPYLSAPDRPVAALARRAAPAGLRVGVVWAGNPGHHNDARRSMPQEACLPWLDVPGAAFFCLHAATAPRPADPRWQVLGPRLADFADTAAAVGSMDLIISVDTAVAHLAGALGRPVWTLLPHAPDWRWLLGRSSSPWYPSMRLFRQPAPGDWASVAAAVRLELAQLAAAPRPMAPRGAALAFA